MAECLGVGDREGWEPGALWYVELTAIVTTVSGRGQRALVSQEPGEDPGN